MENSYYGFLLRFITVYFGYYGVFFLTDITGLFLRFLFSSQGKLSNYALTTKIRNYSLFFACTYRSYLFLSKRLGKEFSSQGPPLSNDQSTLLHNQIGQAVCIYFGSDHHLIALFFGFFLFFWFCFKVCFLVLIFIMDLCWLGCTHPSELLVGPQL